MLSGHLSMSWHTTRLGISVVFMGCLRSPATMDDTTLCEDWLAGLLCVSFLASALCIDRLYVFNGGSVEVTLRMRTVHCFKLSALRMVCTTTTGSPSTKMPRALPSANANRT